MTKYTFIVYNEDNTSKRVHIYAVNLREAWVTIRTSYPENKIECEQNI